MLIVSSNRTVVSNKQVRVQGLGYYRYGKLWSSRCCTYGEILPDVCVAIFSEALVVESVDLRDLTGLVVTAEDCDSLFVPDLQLKHEILATKVFITISLKHTVNVF